MLCYGVNLDTAVRFADPDFLLKCREPACTKSICPVKLYKKSSSSPFARIVRLSVFADRFLFQKL